MGAGIVAAIAAFFVVGAVISEGILHDKNSGVLPGLVAAVWAFWPFMHSERVRRYNFLHPVPKRYTLPLKQAYAKVRKILSDTTYNFGDKWHVTTADTIERRITAQLRYTDEETHLEGNSVNSLHTRTERKQRLLELDVQFSESSLDRTIVQLDFAPRVEGVAWTACDSIITGLTANIEGALGGGEDAGNPADTRLPAPPWWLIGMTALMLVGFFNTINKVIFSK